MKDIRLEPAVFLVADIGGTNARFALAKPKIQGGFTLSQTASFTCADFTGLAAVIKAYLQGKTDESIRQACIAIAAPVNGDWIRMTNLNWQFSIRELTRELDFEHIEVVNDFFAQACAIPYLSDQDVVQIKKGEAEIHAPRLIIGPGTGLGVASLIPVQAGWKPISGEGGHVTLATENQLEDELVNKLRDSAHQVYAEWVLSGEGLIRLHQAMHSIEEASNLEARAITQAALSGDEKARQTLEQFCLFLAGVAGDAALTCGARGGVYLTGGIAPNIQEFIQNQAFIERFTQKGAMLAYLQAIPVYLMVGATPALSGCAGWYQQQYLRQLSQ